MDELRPAEMKGIISGLTSRVVELESALIYICKHRYGYELIDGIKAGAKLVGMEDDFHGQGCISNLSAMQGR
jgi:hypothetical protein